MSGDMTSSRALYSRLLSYVRPYWRAFLAAMVCMGLASLSEPVFPAMMKYMLDDGFAQSQGSWAWLIYPLIILAIFFARAIFGFLGHELGCEQRHYRVAPSNVRANCPPADALL